MKIFCRESHPVKSEPTPKEQLLEARAELERLKLLPLSSFRMVHPHFKGYSVDNKEDRIKIQEAKIAMLKVLAEKE